MSAWKLLSPAPNKRRLVEMSLRNIPWPAEMQVAGSVYMVMICKVY
ncbi:hypothetical protein PDO_3169 [Rhizobium sp. PDO1-076]|nr:hypothetical protein PDO_3169 [Rhizobium sp. PDO1-076]